MLEMSATEVFRFIILAILIVSSLLVIAFIFNALYLSQQVQAASDLLSATGGYMKTEEQQRKWWELTHNPMFRLTDVKFVGLTDADHKAGVTNRNIDRGATNGKTTKYTIYTLPGPDGTGGHVNGSISGDSFDDIEARARNTKGGIALNGPTGVHVNPKALNDKLIGRRGYMMVPAHYGTSIQFTIHTRIPLHYIGKFEGMENRDDASWISRDFVAQTTSLRGSDELYVDSNEEKNSNHEADAEARGLNMLKLAAGTVTDRNSFGYGQIGLDLNDQSKTAYQSKANDVLTKYSAQLQNAKTVDQVVQITKNGLNELAALMSSTRAIDNKTNKPVPLQNTNGQNAILVFKGATGTQFSANNVPGDYTQWPKAD